MRPVRLAVIAFAILYFGTNLKSSILQVPTDTWQSTYNMSSARANAVAVLLPDGRIVFAGGAGADGQATATAEAMSSDGTSSALPAMGAARSGHAAIYTLTGDLLVTGGRTSGGGIVNSAEVFDSLSNTWSSLPTQMVDTRTGHTMSQLPDGNILIAGGENSSGPIAALEIYDIGTRSFRFAGTLTTARKAHAAAVLNDGRVLIVGGTTLLPGGSSATLSSTEIYDPATGSVSSGPYLATPRSGATATTLLDGRVLVTGGSYPEGAQQPPELSSAEIYDPATGSFAASASRLATARTGHQAFLLPNNNNVLIAGGSSAGADLASAELYCPWNDTFQPTTSMSAARAAAAGSALGKAVGDGGDIGVDGMLVVGGGHNLNRADVYGFAWVKTDHTNYAPGRVVTITGSGWQPGETVTLSFLKSPRLDTPPALTAVADANGNIFNNQFSPGEHDLNVRVYLTAAGSQSGVQALNTFTTSIKLYEATIAPTSDTAGHQSAPYTLTITNDPTSTNQLGSATITVPSGYLNVVLGTITQPPAGNFWAAALSGNQITLADIGSSKMPPGQSVSLALTASAPCTAGPYQWSTTAGNFTLVGPQPLVTVTGSCSIGTTTTVASSASPSIYGRGVTFTATVAPNTGSTAPTGTVQFTIDGVAFGSPVTLSASGSNGVANSGSTSTLPVSGSPHSIAANYTPTGDFTGSTGSLQQTVNPAPLTITANSSSKTYGQTVTFAGTEFSSSGLVNGDTVASVTLTSTGAAATAAVGPYPIVPSAATGGTFVASNYTITYVNGTLTVNPAPLTITANSSSKTYGQTVTFAGTEFSSSGLVNGDTVTSVMLTSTGAAATAAVGPYPIVPSAATGTGLTNYTITYANGTLTVNPAPLTITANSSSKTYGQTVTFAGTEFTASGLVNGDTVTSVTLTSTGAPATAAVGPYPIVPSAATGTGLTNYTITYVNGTLTVNAAPLTITANSGGKTYGQTVVFAGTEFTASGLVNGDRVTSVTLTSTGAGAGAVVGPYPIIPSGAVGTGLGSYTITYVNGTLTVYPAPLTITANSTSKTYGQTLSFTGTEFTSSGLVNGDTVISVTLTSDGAPAGAAPGSYPIVPSAAVGTGLGNYTITYVNGTLIVNPASSSLQVGAIMYNIGWGNSGSYTCFDGTPAVPGNTCGFKWLSNNIAVLHPGDLTSLDCTLAYPGTICTVYSSTVANNSWFYSIRDIPAIGPTKYERALLHYVEDMGSPNHATAGLIGVDQFDYWDQLHPFTEGFNNYRPSEAKNGILLYNGSTFVSDLTKYAYSGKIITAAYSGTTTTLTGIATENFGDLTGTVSLQGFTTATGLNGKSGPIISNTGTTMTVTVSCSSHCTGSSETGYVSKPQTIPAGDTLYVGYMEPIDIVKVKLATAQVGGSVTYQYSKGSGVWGDLTTAPNWTDGTSGLTVNGNLTFYPPTDWAIDTVTGTGGPTRSKFWIHVTPTGASTQPSIFSLRTDNMLSAYNNASGQCGTLIEPQTGTACLLRGWSASAYAASTACSGSPCVVAGGYQYNPTPPATASARFYYQARSGLYGGYNNATWFNPSATDTDGKTLVGKILPVIWDLTKAAYPAYGNGAAWDNVGATNTGDHGLWTAGNWTDLACSHGDGTGCLNTLTHDDFENYWLTAMQETTANQKTEHGSQFYVSGNLYVTHPTSAELVTPPSNAFLTVGSISHMGAGLDNVGIEFAAQAVSPGYFASFPQTQENMYNVAAPPATFQTQTANSDHSYQYGFCNIIQSGGPCLPVVWNRAIQGTMAALTSQYMFKNSNSVLVYTITSESSYNAADQYYFFQDSGATLTAPITAGLHSETPTTFTFPVTTTTPLAAMQSNMGWNILHSCQGSGCGLDNPFAGNIIVRICPNGTTCETGDIFQVNTTPPFTVKPLSNVTQGGVNYVGVANSYVGNEKVQIMNYGHAALTPVTSMPPWQAMGVYATLAPSFRVDIGVPDSITGWKPPDGNCYYNVLHSTIAWPTTPCNPGDPDLYYGASSLSSPDRLLASAQIWSGLPCSGGKWTSPHGTANMDCAPLARRDYTNAIVLLRTARTGGTLPSAPEEWETYSKPIDLSSFESRCAPYCTYYRLRPDGTTDPGTSSVNLRGAEGAVMMKTPVIH